jgi:hypothetical protein
MEDARRLFGFPDGGGPRHPALGCFETFVDAALRGDPADEICRGSGISPTQYDRYERAWMIVQAVSEEIGA